MIHFRFVIIKVCEVTEMFGLAEVKKIYLALFYEFSAS